MRDLANATDELIDRKRFGQNLHSVFEVAVKPLPDFT
jgi:hypothetical protein